LLAVLLLAGCGQEPKAPPHKYQLLVVLDKSKSVTYQEKRDHIKAALTEAYNHTYAPATKDIQSSILVITGSTNVFPELYQFEMNYPEGEEGSRMYEDLLHKWDIAKRKWLSERVQEVLARIDSPCTSNTTDIFSIFSGISQVQQNGGPWDSIVVVIFSDMVNTRGSMNMVREINMGNAKAKGREVCSRLITSGEMSRMGNGNLYFTIYTPDNMGRTNEIYQFWTGFFEQWGLRPEQVRFE
jgi:hypothetical protein